MARSEQWWRVYRRVFVAVHGHETDGKEFSPLSHRVTEAAFDELGIPKMPIVTVAADIEHCNF